MDSHVKQPHFNFSMHIQEKIGIWIWFCCNLNSQKRSLRSPDAPSQILKEFYAFGCHLNLISLHLIIWETQCILQASNYSNVTIKQLLQNPRRIPVQTSSHQHRISSKIIGKEHSTSFRFVIMFLRCFIVGSLPTSLFCPFGPCLLLDTFRGCPTVLECPFLYFV